MKTYKFLLTLFVVLTFFAISSYAQQGHKIVVDSWTDCVSEYPFPCIGETISGCEEYTLTLWDFKGQMRVKGTFVGDDTGTVYYFTATANWKGIFWTPGQIIMGVETRCFEDEYGNVIYTYHHNDHQTINANDVITAEFWRDKVYLSCE